jgi:hypothetical protein
MKTLITASTAAMAAATVALAFPVIASAQAEWDIGAYDQCWNSGLGKGFTQEEFDEHVHHCCVNSGGIWTGTKCVAPPAEQAQVSSTRWVGEVPVQVFEPTRPTTRVVDGVDVHQLTEAP